MPEFFLAKLFYHTVGFSLTRKPKVNKQVSKNTVKSVEMPSFAAFGLIFILNSFKNIRISILPFTDIPVALARLFDWFCSIDLRVLFA